jgi:2,3-bisphosphoglycerate-dependent phosphoglycerate mutase
MLVLIRHGQSQYNLENRFTGWVDVPLTATGEQEARQTGKALQRSGFIPEQCFTSNLQRAQRTLDIILEEIHRKGDVPVTRNEALNERHYGDLQGKNKAETATEFGEEQVHIWRRSFDIAPPNGESLKDTAARTLPYFDQVIIPLLKKNKNILVVAHGNSLRSIVMEIEKLSPAEILKKEIGTGVAWFYDVKEMGDQLKFQRVEKT